MFEDQLYPINKNVMVSIKDIQFISFSDGILKIVTSGNEQTCQCTANEHTALIRAIDQIRPFFGRLPSQLCG